MELLTKKQLLQKGRRIEKVELEDTVAYLRELTAAEVYNYQAKVKSHAAGVDVSDLAAIEEIAFGNHLMGDLLALTICDEGGTVQFDAKDGELIESRMGNAALQRLFEVAARLCGLEGRETTEELKGNS